MDNNKNYYMYFKIIKSKKIDNTRIIIKIFKN
jgi:hypothetical protein